MDYCHACRRHLNGALVCPGCGTPAEALRTEEPQVSADPPRGTGYGEEASQVAQAAHLANSAYEERHSGARDDTETDDSGDRDDMETGDTEIPEPGSGTSRRDRKAAAHRRRRRRTLFVAAGFVLAAGGLSLAELGVDAPGLGPGPAAAGGKSPDGSAAEVKDTARPDGDAAAPGGASATRTPKASASASPSASGSPSASATSGKGAKGEQSATAGTLPDRPTPSGPAPSAPGTTAPATTSPTTQAPPPDPAPSETCSRFLWWCA